MLREENNNPRPIRKINWNVKGKIKNGKTFKTFNWGRKKSGKTTINPTKKLIKLARIVEIGKISTGRATCFRSGTLLTMESVASDRAVEKNIQGIIAESANK